jgi:hypothetical protein
MAVFVIDALMPWRRRPSAAATRGGECCVGSDAARNARRLALADAEALIRDRGAEAYCEARQRERDRSRRVSSFRGLPPLLICGTV